MSRHLFLTGASGFVGANLLEYVLGRTTWNVTCPVTMRHHGRQDALSGLYKTYGPDRMALVNCDLSMPFTASVFEERVEASGPVDYIWNVASESHVDRSITDPVPFVRNNVDLMLNVLEFARRQRSLRLFLHMSTDEVYGALEAGGLPHAEWATIRPSNPYSASKACQEAVAFSYWRGFGLPLIITNTMNLVGPWQAAEKFVPKTISALWTGRPVTVHTDPQGMSGSRCWIDVVDFANAWHALTVAFDTQRDDLTYYPAMLDEPLRYNIAGPRMTNLDVATTLAELLGVDQPDIRIVDDFHSSRPGHDMHYALDSGLFEDEFGWKPRPLPDSLASVCNWYLDHPHLLEAEL